MPKENEITPENPIKEMKDKWLESGNSEISMDSLEVIVVNEPKVQEAFSLINQVGGI